MKEAKARREEREHRRRRQLSRREGGRGARLVVVFQEAPELVLIIQSSLEVLAYRTGASLAEAIIKSLVVSVIESLLLERPFEVPVNLGKEAKVRMTFAHAPGCLWP